MNFVDMFFETNGTQYVKTKKTFIFEKINSYIENHFNYFSNKQIKQYNNVFNIV